MKFAKRIYHFIGSIYFTFILIGLVAIMTIAGTFIESLTQSHQFAARYTYSHPLFAWLLWGFFLNILISALRRWPFKPRHIPFLITHFGLLLILAGVLAKKSYGTQGVMSMIEGGGSEEVLLLDQPTLVVTHSDRRNTELVAIDRQKSHWEFLHDLQLDLVSYAPHSTEHFETWIKGNQLSIQGIPPLPVYAWNKEQPLAISGKVYLHAEDAQLWEVLAYHTDDLDHLIQSAYLRGLEVHANDILTGESLQKAKEWDLQWNFSPTEGFQEAKIFFAKDAQPFDLLSNKKQLSQNLVTYSLTRELPVILFIRDSSETLFLIIFDQYGHVHSQIMPQNSFASIIVYDEGFGGYAIKADIPIGHSKPYQEAIQKKQVIANLEQGMQEKLALAPPLELLQKACISNQVDFAETCTDFLFAWNETKSWLYPLEKPLPAKLEAVLAQLDWNSLSKNERYTSEWISLVFSELEMPLDEKMESLHSLLEKKKWPLLKDLHLHKTKDSQSQLTILTQQIFSAHSILPKPPRTSLSPQHKARFLSAFLRAYNIHLLTLGEPQCPPFSIETTLSLICKKAVPITKIEENRPLITLKATQQDKSKLITLAYDRYATGLKWPLFGHNLMRFQPKIEKIPYRIRLRHARQVNYPGSLQPYSFESDLLITDLRTSQVEEKTISMNRVYETWDGYRFYLANISPTEAASVKRIQLIVNHDPAKYWLTYPGAIVLSLGIVLLFWIRPRRN